MIVYYLSTKKVTSRLKDNLKNKIAILTGITGGIGKSIANKLIENNIKVIGLTSKKKSQQKDIFKKFSNYKNLVEIFTCNLENNKQVEETCLEIKQKYGCPDIIINNAGQFHFKNLECFSLDEIISSYNVNIIAPIIICKFFISELKKKKWGRIINICSSSSYSGGGTPGHTIYGSTKHALLGFSRALDEEVRKSNIRIGTISPAGVSTDMVKNRKDLDQDSMMASQEVADALFFLLESDGKGIVYEMRLWRMLR